MSATVIYYLTYEHKLVVAKTEVYDSRALLVFNGIWYIFVY